MGGTSPATVDFDPLSAAQRADPYPVLAQARREAPVFHAERFGFWVVTRHEDVLAVLKDEGTFSSEGALTSTTEPLPPEVEEVLDGGWPSMPVIVDTDPPLHTAIRGLITRAFTPRRIAEMEPRIRLLADELLDELAPAGEGDVVERFAWPLPLRVIGDMLGLPREDLDRLHAWANDWLALHQPGHSLERQLELARSTVALQEYFMAALDRRAADPEPGDDLMGALLAAARELDPPLAPEVVVGVPFDLLIAGHVTVTRAIGNALVLLLDEPGRIGALLEDPERVPAAVEEILRLESPAQGLFRRTTRPVELGGASLPAGAKVMVHFGSANRDERVFADADAYRPEREGLHRHVAFGKGIHFCVGAPLARLELRVALPLLLERLPGLRYAPGAAPEHEPIFFARGLSALGLAWDTPTGAVS